MKKQEQTDPPTFSRNRGVSGASPHGIKKILRVVAYLASSPRWLPADRASR